MKTIDAQAILLELERANSHPNHKADLSVDGVKVHLQRDLFAPEGVCMISLAIETKGMDEIALHLASDVRTNSREDLGLLIHGEGMNERVIWLPQSPKIFVLDEVPRIVQQHTCPNVLSVRGHDIVMECHNLCPGLLVIPMVVSYSESGEGLLEEIFDLKGETVPIEVEGEGGGICLPSEFWNFHVLGKIYNPKWGAHGRIPSEQTAYGLFRAFLALEHLTGLKIWGVFRKSLLRSVLLRLDETGFWYHGEWGTPPETHARLQTDGLNLLLDGYRLFRQEELLEGVRRALHGLLRMTEGLHGHGLWFLHDGLEHEAPERFSTYRKALRTKHLGKTPGNTLCLNTHVYALTAVYRCMSLMQDESDKDAFERGVFALEALLKRTPRKWLHGFMSRMIDWAFTNGANFCFTDRVLNRLTRRWTQERLYRWNRWSPSLIMPNGYILRDLELPFYGLWYHLVNLYDLMILWLSHPCDGLYPVIARGWEYCLKGPLIPFLLIHRPASLPQWAEVCVLASKCGLISDPAIVSEQLSLLRERKIPFTPGVYGFNPLHTDQAGKISQGPNMLLLECSGKPCFLDLSSGTWKMEAA